MIWALEAGVEIKPSDTLSLSSGASSNPKTASFSTIAARSCALFSPNSSRKN